MFIEGAGAQRRAQALVWWGTTRRGEHGRNQVLTVLGLFGEPFLRTGITSRYWGG